MGLGREERKMQEYMRLIQQMEDKAKKDKAKADKEKKKEKADKRAGLLAKIGKPIKPVFTVSSKFERQ